MALSEAAVGLDACYPAQPPQVAVIRRAVADVARASGADMTTLLRLELAVSEAATNVVLHAYRMPGSAGDIQVAASADGEAFEVRIRDQGGGMGPRADSPGMGLGLSLMAGECDHFAVRAVNGGGTEVLMRFLLPRREPAGRRRFAREPGAGAPARA